MSATEGMSGEYRLANGEEIVSYEYLRGMRTPKERALESFLGVTPAFIAAIQEERDARGELAPLARQKVLIVARQLDKALAGLKATYLADLERESGEAS